MKSVLRRFVSLCKYQMDATQINHLFEFKNLKGFSNILKFSALYKHSGAESGRKKSKHSKACNWVIQ